MLSYKILYLLSSCTLCRCIRVFGSMFRHQKIFTSIDQFHFNSYVRYIKIQTWLRSFVGKITNFSRLHCLSIPRSDLTKQKQNGPNGPFASNSLLRPKPFSKVAIIKTKNVTIAFFSSPPFLHLALSLSPFLFLRYYDFEASRV